MVNTLELKKEDVVAALEAAAQCKAEKLLTFKPVVPRDGCYWFYVGDKAGFVDLKADDGFDEDDYDKAFGPGAAQRAIDRLRADF